MTQNKIIMEIQNTLENKAKFFALYWGIKAMAVTLNENDFRQKVNFTNMNKYHVEFCHLELKPISLITEKDSDDFNLAFCYDINQYGFTRNKIRKNWTASNIDELRLRGYALPWMGLSVEKLVEYGWVKLKTE